MTKLTHKQAQRYLRMDLDGLLSPAQHVDLETHLRDCESCRSDSESLSSLTTHLQTEFHARWDDYDGPSKQVLENVRSQTRRIMMQKRFDLVFNVLGSAAALLVLFFVISSVVAQLQKKSAASNGNQTATPASLSQGKLIAFVSKQNGNNDIYTMNSDGSNVINLTNNPADDNFPVWSPDGTRIAFTSNRDGNENIYVMNLDGSNLTRITDDTGQDTNPLWSPDGTKIAYQSGTYSDPINTNIYVVDADGQNKKRLTNYLPNTTVWPNTWSPDSQFILFEVNKQIVQISIRDDNLTPLTSPAEYDISISSKFILSANGSKLIYFSECDQKERSSSDFCQTVNSINRYSSTSESQGTLRIQNVCEIKDTSKTHTYFGRALWSPDRTKIIFAFLCEGQGGFFYIANVDGSDFKPLTSDPILNMTTNFDWSYDSQSILFASEPNDTTHGNLYKLNINEALANPNIQPTPLDTSARQVSWLYWQPIPNYEAVNIPTPEPTKTTASNRLIAYVSEQDGNKEIYTMKADGSDMTNLTNNPANDFNPVWSPDGTRIAFESDRNGNHDIYVMNLSDISLTRLTNDSANDILPEWYTWTRDWQGWSPDEKHILYRSDHNGKWDLFVANTDGSGVLQLTQANDPAVANFVWSPTGQKTAYTLQNNDTVAYIVNADGTGRQQVSLPSIAFNSSIFSWAPQGNALYYGGSDCNNNNSEGCSGPATTLYRVPLDGSQAVKLAKAPENMQDWIIRPSNVIFVRNLRFKAARNPGPVDDLVWYETDGKTTKQLYEWSNLEEKCTKPNPENQGGYAFSRYDDWTGTDKHLVLAINCVNDGVTWLYLINEDGSHIQLLSNEAIPGLVGLVQISADGHLALFEEIDSSGTSTATYSLDLASAQNDPSTRPMRLDAVNVRAQPVPYQFTTKPVQVLPTPSAPAIASPVPLAQKDLIAFTRDGSLYLMNKDGSGERKLTSNSLSVNDLHWSPDGNQIVFDGQEGNLWSLYLINVDGSGLLKLADNAWYAVWSPDGKQIAYVVYDLQNQQSYPTRIEIIKTDGTVLRTIPLDKVNGVFDSQYSNLQWSEDNKFIQFSTTTDPTNISSEKATWTIYQASAADGKLQTLLEVNRPIINWQGDNSNLTYLINDLTQWLWKRGSTILTSTDVFTKYHLASTNWAYSWWSPDKKKLLIAVDDGRLQNYAILFLANADGSNLKQLTSTGVYMYSTGQTMGWSPDGRYLVFTSDVDSPNNYDIYKLDIQAALKDPKTALVRLTTSGFNETLPVWQPKP